MITSLRLQNFRSYGSASFEFDEGVNIVVGPNASGKTNLLEAVLVLCWGRSYRGRDTDLIKFGRPWSRLDGYFDGINRTLKIELHENALEKTYIFDEKSYKRLSLDKTVPAVYFEPNHLQLITRGPEQRRDYFDDLLERSQLEFRSLNLAYRRTLSQRNALLKRGPRAGANQLFAWNIRLSELAGKVAKARQELADDINKEIAKTYSKIAHKKSTVKLDYQNQFPIDNYSSRMLSKLESSEAADYERGFTGAGPHREDYGFELNKQPANQSASRGESRSIMLALKIFELELMERTRGQKPVFLLDDVFSELDSSRRQALVTLLAGVQTIITTTDADTVIEYFAAGNHRLISTK